jgi:hypothetical protein
MRYTMRDPGDLALAPDLRGVVLPKICWIKRSLGLLKVHHPVMPSSILWPAVKQRWNDRI